MPKSPSRTSKKKKYNARFPPARIKKIMQTDEEVGKVAAAVPVIISRALELFIESLISETSKTTIAKNAKTLSTSHIKQTIESHKQFDFLRDLVSSVPDHQTEDNNGDTAAADGEVSSRKGRGRPRKQTDASGRRKRGESSKASSDTSEEEEDEEDDEDTETDDENARVYATATTTTPSSSSTPFDALGDPQSRLIPSSVPSSSTAAPAMFMPNPQTFIPPGVPPSFTNPTMASLQKQQQQLQPYQQFHEKQQQQQQQQQPLSYPSSNMPPYPGTPIPPILMPHQQQGMPNYPLPPQFPNAYQHMMPSSQHVHQQHPSSGHIPEQHQSQPMNLSFSNRAMATTAAENDDYDT